MQNSKHEGCFHENGRRIFREHILKLLGINYSYRRSGPTNYSTINELYMDFTFKTTEEDQYTILNSKPPINRRKKI